MSYTYTVQIDLNLVLVQLQGDMTYLQEVEAISVVLLDDRIRKNVRILVDRTQAPIIANPEKVNQFVEVVAKSRKDIGRPKIAIVVADEVDYGMTRLLELQSNTLDSHDIRVFFEIDYALKWLDIEMSDLVH